MFDDLRAVANITSPTVVDEIGRWTYEIRRHVEHIAELTARSTHTHLVRHLQHYPVEWYQGPRLEALNLAVRLTCLPNDPTYAVERLAKAIHAYRHPAPNSQHDTAQALLARWEAHA